MKPSRDRNDTAVQTPKELDNLVDKLDETTTMLR
jgi:hypothetical protein